MTRCAPSLGLLCAVLLYAASTQAQPTTDARDYEGSYFLPKDSQTFATWAYYRHQTTATKRNLTTNLGIFRATYTLKFKNFVFTPFDALVPYADADLKLYTDTSSDESAARGPTSARPLGPVATGSVRNHGFADVQFLPSAIYHIVEDAATATHSYIGGNVYVYIPIGNYSSRDLVNIGENRWGVKPQLAIGQRFAKRFTIDLVANTVLYAGNDNYPVTTSRGRSIQTLKQDPTYNAEVHFAVDLHPTMYMAASYYFAALGKEYLDNGRATEVEPQSNVHTLRLSWGIHIEQQSLLLIQLQQDLMASAESSNTRFFGVRFSHFFHGPTEPPPSKPGAESEMAP